MYWAPDGAISLYGIDFSTFQVYDKWFSRICFFISFTDSELYSHFEHRGWFFFGIHILSLNLCFVMWILRLEWFFVLKLHSLQCFSFPSWMILMCSFKHRLYPVLKTSSWSGHGQVSRVTLCMSKVKVPWLGVSVSWWRDHLLSWSGQIKMPSQMDVAPWCYKWIGDGLDIWGEVQSALRC